MAEERILGSIAVKFFEQRKIEAETPARYGVYTGRRINEDGDVTPDANGDVICYPVIDLGVERFTKYRGRGKKFWQTKGGKRTFWNADAMDDVSLHDGRNALVITEGYEDALAAIDSGYVLTVSVPDGAPGVPKGKTPEDLDPLDPKYESEGKFEFMFNNRDRLKRIKRFIIATDGDEAGRRLAAEMVRRLGAVRCAFIEYPPDQVVKVTDRKLYPDGLRACKDLNEVRVAFGPERVIQLLAAAKAYPVRGLYRLSDYPETKLETYTTGWEEFRHKMRVYLGEFIVVTGIPSSGKALALDTPIPTPSGWTTMGDIQVGDVVYDEAGSRCRVTRATGIMRDHDCYRLKFDDGTEVVADAGHQWLTTSEKSRHSALVAARKRGGRDWTKPRGTDQRHLRTFPSVVTTEQIADTLRSQGKRSHQVKLAAPFSGHDTIMPVDPYLLGVWLGDGTSASGQITCFEAEILDQIAVGGGVSKKNLSPGRYNVEGLSPYLRILGVLNNKHVPRSYQRALVSKRLALLQGLMDTDGYCCPKTHRCEFTSVNERLARDVLELASGLGLKASMLEGRATLNGRDCGPKYRVCFMADIQVFRLPRKISAQGLGRRNRRTKDRTIVACERVPSVPVRCIEVDSSSHLFLATRSFIPTHNSTWMLNLVANLCSTHGWRAAMCTPEMPTVPNLRDALRRYWIGRKPILGEGDELKRADAWINNRFVHIDTDPTGMGDEDEAFSLEWVIEKATDAVLRDGIRVLVIDPWNELEHSRQKGESQPDYIARGIRMLKRFGRLYGVIVIVVAHPTKDVLDKGNVRKPTLYDIDGAAAWYNKADHGIVVHRDREQNLTEVWIRKVRFEGAGDDGAGIVGKVDLRFNAEKGRYYALDAPTFAGEVDPGTGLVER